MSVGRRELREAAPAGVLQYPRVLFTLDVVVVTRAARARALPMAGQEGRVFLLNSCLIRLIYLLIRSGLFDSQARLT